MTETAYPAGWDVARVRRVLKHYETQADEEAAAEDEAVGHPPKGGESLDS